MTGPKKGNPPPVSQWLREGGSRPLGARRRTVPLSTWQIWLLGAVLLVVVVVTNWIVIENEWWWLM